VVGAARLRDGCYQRHLPTPKLDDLWVDLDRNCSHEHDGLGLAVARITS